MDLTTEYDSAHIEQNAKYLDTCNLIYEAICILEPYYKKDAILNKSFHRIFEFFAFAYDSYLFYNRDRSHGRLKDRVFALKNNLYKKMMFVLRDELLNPNLIGENSILDAFCVGFSFIQNFLFKINFFLLFEKNTIDELSGKLIPINCYEDLLRIVCKSIYYSDEHLRNIGTISNFIMKLIKIILLMIVNKSKEENFFFNYFFILLLI